jgi:hypothetical protein
MPTTFSGSFAKIIFYNLYFEETGSTSGLSQNIFADIFCLLLITAAD